MPEGALGPIGESMNLISWGVAKTPLHPFEVTQLERLGQAKVFVIVI